MSPTRWSKVYWSMASGRSDTTVAAHVWCNDVETGCRKRGKLMAPRVPGFRKAVTQDNKRALALLGDVQTNAVGFDAALYDRASRHSETIARDPATARRYRTTRQAVECLRSFGPRRLCLVARLWRPFGLIRFLFGHFLLRALGRWCRRHCHAIHFSEPAAGKPIDTGPWAALESQRRLPTATGTPADVDGGRLAQPRDNIAFAHADSDATANERPCIGDAGTRRVRRLPQPAAAVPA